MIEWQELRSEYDTGLEKLSAGDLSNEQRTELQKRVSQLGGLLVLHDAIVDAEKQIADTKEQLESESDNEIKDLFKEEIAEIEQTLAQHQKDLTNLLAPPDACDMRSAFIEIRAGAGGQESSLFVADMYRMYMLYAQKHYWEVGIAEESRTDVGGYRELVLYIKGRGVFAHLKFEAGVHRVQRVPSTESAGRIHTSTVTVAVMAEAEEVDITINPADLRIDTYRASGAGGQHVNTTDSAIRIVHIPTGVTVCCQDERSQIKNKNKAMKMLRARLFEAERQRLAAERSSTRKDQVGSGGRSEKIRTYNYPQNRITDHRIGLTLKKLDIVMEGNLEEVINALMDEENAQRTKNVTI